MMNKTQLIEAVLPGVLTRNGITDPASFAAGDARHRLESYATGILQQMYDRQVAAGLITPPPPIDTHQPNQQDIAAAKLKAQQLAQDAIKRSPEYAENQKLRRDNERLTDQLRKAEIVIDVQKKVAMLLGLPIAETEVS